MNSKRTHTTERRCDLRRFATGFVLPALLCAQQPTPPAEIHVSSRAYVPSPARLQVETKLVDMSVTVRDGKGRAVRGLKQEDFQIFDDGKERAIAAFAEEVEIGRAFSPTAPDAPKISTVCPRRSASPSRPSSAVKPVVATAPASRRSRPFGIRATCAASAAANSA